MQQLHWGWIVAGALALAAVLWWLLPDDGVRGVPAGHHATDAGAPSANGADSGPTLYRWVDAHGVVNVTTDPPPAGRSFRIVHIDPNRNIVPMSGSTSGSAAPTQAR